eukprot:TRINITY_DN7441_c1_g1_i1.p1 TRINITY_DN7441_c1_g1~~TRINITY_DN7441_c1_g1_i1.p1  ORF type:complete len:712 (+),score=86.01 TRINITY_DN7441_c1_g1_i1:180-2315(+)
MPLGSRTDAGDARFAGRLLPFTCDIIQAITETVKGAGLDFLLTTLVHPRNKRAKLLLQAESELDGFPAPPFARTDMLMPSSDWGGQVVGVINDWIDPDSPNLHLQHRSIDALKQELGWAAHLGLQAVVLPTPKHGTQCYQYAQTVNEFLGGITFINLWVRIPIVPPQCARSNQEEEDDMATSAPAEFESGTDSWEWWHAMRGLCSQHSHLGVILDLGAYSELQLQAWMIDRWKGEPVRAVLIATDVFKANNRKFPSLAQPFQYALSEFMKQGVQVILQGQPQEYAVETAGSRVVQSEQAANGSVAVVQNGEAEKLRVHPLKLYQEYLSYLFHKLPVPQGQEQLELNYRDYIQSPLQPLQDNLESQTYETFERDRIKYDLYERAIHNALKDMKEQRKQAADKLQNQIGQDQFQQVQAVQQQQDIVIMVVGAGRGPLVRASLNAAEKVGVKIRVYAVEKNPFAVITLQSLVDMHGWHDQVRVISCDMRIWDAPEEADILVSELLGSFGDNELSPECLDGAQRFLKRGGISIPKNYTSYAAPITTDKVIQQIKNFQDQKQFHTPFVVKLNRFTLLAQPKPVFHFHHPNYLVDSPQKNERFITLQFTKDDRCYPDKGGFIQGIVGYFSSVLYENERGGNKVMLSTHPEFHTPGMHSWFPIVFPLKEGQYLGPQQDVEISFWRKVGRHKVWYEWAVSKPQFTQIQNAGGKSYFVGL